ncbi:AAA family ATPase [Bacillus sp. V3]|nr:AAA family ATPase [Bacillus sp. V3]
MLQEIIEKINEIFDDAHLPYVVNATDYDACIVKQLRITEIIRRGSRESVTSNGVINNNLYSRDSSTTINTNATTHIFIPSASVEILPPLLPNVAGMNYALTVPVKIDFATLHLMLKELPTGYYDSSKVTDLKTKYPLGDSYELGLSAKATTGNRVMFHSKDFIINSNHKEFFMELRYSQFADDYMILLKEKKSYNYKLIFIPKDLGETKNIENYLDRIHGNTKTAVPSSYFSCEEGKNLIVFGAPGTGKSFWIKENFESKSETLRVTFHPEYTYNEFVGSLKPVQKGSNFSYKFVPGPFTRILELAYLNPNVPYTLIIEEINRSNTAAVFGDIFQILDRNVDGYSEYGIENEDILEYLNHKLPIQLKEVTLPPNLNLIATMNSADQGVFQMDTAFKRRWNVKYVPIEFELWHETTSFDYYNKKIPVKEFITTLNEFLSSNQLLKINEDRLVGPYYLKKEEAEKWLSGEYYKKLFIYLWDDIARINRDYLFKAEYRQFSELCYAFENGNQVFVEELHNKLIAKRAKPTGSTTDISDTVKNTSGNTELDYTTYESNGDTAIQENKNERQEQVSDEEN